MQTRIAAAVLALMLMLPAFAASGAEPRGTLLSSSPAPRPASEKYRAVADCARSVQTYWPRTAGLVLENKARIRSASDGRVISMSGWVWRDGTRRKVDHECVVLDGSDRLALRILDGDMLIAQVD